jgi:hypothetical protein
MILTKNGLCHPLALRDLMGRRFLGMTSFREMLNFEFANPSLKTLDMSLYHHVTKRSGQMNTRCAQGSENGLRRVYGLMGETVRTLFKAD